mmetsp:Transcript_142007/g.395797  ORF Transcript_142007/g.395797 Transcript_142007/m.395797 type:complete len:342 (-) Transcript_142007:394-1419(-)
MDCLALHAHALQAAGQLIAHAFRLREDDDLAVSLAQAINEVRFLLAHVVADDDLLIDVRVCLQLIGVADAHLHGVLEEILGHLPHLLGPRGSEHHGLPSGRHVGDDLADLRLEAHVQHTVRLVQNQETNIAEAHHATLQEVIQAAGRPCQQVRPPPQVRKLRPFWRAAVSQRGDHAGGAGEALRVRIDLDGQLAGGRHDQHDGGTHHPLDQHLCEGGEEEAKGLARTRLRDANHVAVGHRNRPRVALDGARGLEARLQHGLDELLGQLHLVEARPGWRDVAIALHRDLRCVTGRCDAQVVGAGLRRRRLVLLLHGRLLLLHGRLLLVLLLHGLLRLRPVAP